MFTNGNGNEERSLFGDAILKNKYKLVGIEVVDALSKRNIPISLTIGGMAFSSKMFSTLNAVRERKLDVNNKDNFDKVNVEVIALAEEIKKAIIEPITGKSFNEILAALAQVVVDTVELKDQVEEAKASEFNVNHEKCNHDCANCDLGKKEEEKKPIDMVIDLLIKAKENGANIDIFKL